MANRGNIFSVLLSGLRDTSGVSLSGGTVYFYAPGTVIAKSVYTDDDLTNAVNSVELDANGQAEIYGRGLYDVVVKDADDAVLYSWESVFLGKDVFVSTSVIADYNATADDSLILVDTTAGNVTITLPDPATMQQAPYIVKTTDDANTVTVSRADTTINGDANYVISSQWEGVQIAFDETNFYTLGNYATIATTITTEATTSTAGKVELATDAEAIAGTDALRALVPANLTAAVFPGLANFLTGLTLAAAADTAHDITIVTGTARDAVNAQFITLGSAITKQIDANWAAGTNAGGFPSGLTIASNTWYRVFVIRNPTSGAVDAGFDTSATAATLLADATGFTQYALVGWVLTDGSANISHIVSQNTADTSAARQKIGTSGYYRLPGGLLVQWGVQGQLNANSGADVTFPLTFFTACIGIYFGTSTTADANDVWLTHSSVTTSGFRIANGGAIPTGSSNFWIALGY